MRSLMVMLVFVGLAGHAPAAGEPALMSAPWLDASQSRQVAPEPAGELKDWRSLLAAEQTAACCKICRKGKACGDSCIKKSNTCHKGQGCACDAE